jgi:hypothetical protein
MLYDLRTYICRPGTVGAQLEFYASKGFATQSRHLGAPRFYGIVETGNVNAYVHLWQFENAADRENRRAALYRDPDWLDYRREGAAAGYQTEQTTMLLKPAPFWTPAAGEADRRGREDRS